MTNNSRHAIVCLLTAVAAIILTGCDRRMVYHHYEHTPSAGWERNDTITFTTAPADSGRYVEEVGLRIDNSYPFMRARLIVEQTVCPDKRVRLCDTLNCNLVSETGYAKGDGINSYQYRFPLREVTLRQGEWLYITLRHDMKREILPGITDAGICILRK